MYSSGQSSVLAKTGAGCQRLGVMREAKENSTSNSGWGRYVGPNPLHDGVARPQLLVELVTDCVIEKAALKENWEVPGGCEYDDGPAAHNRRAFHAVAAPSPRQGR